MKLTDIQLDALKEAGSIGAGHAATALSQMLDRKVYLSVSAFKTVPWGEVSDMLDDGDGADVVAVYLRMLGDITGGIAFVLASGDAVKLVNSLKVEGGRRSVSGISEMEKMVVKEVGALIIASYLRAIGDFLKISVIPSAPNVAHDKLGKILQTVLGYLSRRAALSFCIDTEFKEDSGGVTGKFLWIPDRKSFDLIVSKL